MQQVVFTDQKVCKIIGNPDFDLMRCNRCREDADPLYKQCLTIRITTEKIKHKADQIGTGAFNKVNPR